jgi:hypothetical protein
MSKKGDFYGICKKGDFYAVRKKGDFYGKTKRGIRVKLILLVFRVSF